jgi:hypothetical protein
MLEFIKMFGLGILYTLLFPFIVVIFALYIVYVFVNYLVLEVVNVFGFFLGYTFTDETELEKKLDSIKSNSAEIEESRENEFDDFLFGKDDLTTDLEGSDEHE